MEIYNHISEESEDNDYDDTLHPEATKNFTLVLFAALLLAGVAVWIVSNMGLFNPN